MKKLISIFLLFALPSLAARPFPSRHLEGRRVLHDGNSGVQGPSYENIVAEMKALATAHPGKVELIQYGVTLQNRPLMALRIGAPASRGGAARKMVVITGATHGDEYLGFEDKLAAAFLNSNPSTPGFTRYMQTGNLLYIVPIFNPDGYTLNTRGNAKNVDLNRDFPLKQFPNQGFSQPETKFLAQFVDGELRKNNAVLAATLDYHCCFGALLYPYSYATPTPPPVVPADLQAFQKIGQMMQAVFGKDYVYGTTPDILSYSAVGTTKDYYYENYKSTSFTFEGEPDGLEKLALHVQWWDQLLGSLAVTPTERWIRALRR